VITTAVDATGVFRELGPPVVVKPLDGNQGRGVSLSVADEDQLAEAFRAAQEHSKRVVIERMVTGRDYRVLIVNGAMIAASEKTPAHVIGDGSHSIAELIEITNRDPRRGEHHSKPLSCMEPDTVMTAYLARSGRGLHSVPASGEWVLLRESANLSTGGEARDVTDDVHPTIARLCERAARVIGLDIAGIDIVLPDISEPFSRGGIVEVNAAPGIRMHESPSAGQPRNAASAIVDMLFPNGSNGRIPIVAITGTNGKTTTTRMIGSLLRAARKTVGMTTTDGIYIGGHEIARGDMTGPWSARVVLTDPTVEVAVLETARGGIVRSGLGYDWSDVAVYTNIQRDHIGQDGIESVDDIYCIKRLIAERVREGGTIILNADDEILARLPHDRRVSGTPRQIVYFSLSSTNPLVQTHVHAGGTAYVLHAGWVEVRRAESQRRIVRASTVPCTLGGTAEFQIANVLAAIAAAAAVGMSLQDIVAGLESFQNGCQNSGRVNLFEVNGGVMVIDYGHNAHAITGIVRMVSRWPAQRRITVLGLPGDRTDDLIIDATRAAASGFERIILREDYDLRGRTSGEITSLMHHCLREQFPAVQVETILDEVDAVRAAAEHMRPGDVVVAFCDRKDLIADALRQLNAAPISEAHSVVDMLRESVRIPA
jgi:cyanophycin synthetase